MNGKGQFYLNVGITVILGVYGLIGTLYSEWFKPAYERNENAIALLFTLLLAVFAVGISMLSHAYKYLKDDRESEK